MNYKFMITGLLSLQMLFIKISWNPTTRAMDGEAVAAEVSTASKEIKNSCKPTKLINVPYINQNDIVYGCEAVSLVLGQ